MVSTEGRPAAEIARRLRERLTAEGWRTRPDLVLARRHGWLLDKRITLLSITERPTGVAVELAGPDRSPW